MNNQKRILIVDDDEDILTAGELLLNRHFGDVITSNQPDQIPSLMEKYSIDAILLDMNFSPGENSGGLGIKWLKHIIKIDPDAVVVMITAHGGVDTVVEAMKHGATDFIAKPWQNEKVIATLSSAVQLYQTRTEATRLRRSNQALVEASKGFKQSMLGASDAMAAVHSIIRRTAPTDANVMIIGENGTGKELVAHELHQQSLRRNNVFMSVDLGAVSESLFESELFGHKKGAFTGANKDRVGRLVAANGGTLFLDEISNIPLHLQAKLLTVLEQRQVTPLGCNKAITIDVRVIAATNLSRDTLGNDQKFRQDLLFRLNTVEIMVPPLRHRVEDIPEIARYYAQFYTRKYRKVEKKFSQKVIEAAKTYHWPGNVRALRHAVERAVILSEGEEFEVNDMQLDTVAVPQPINHFNKNIDCGSTVVESTIIESNRVEEERLKNSILEEQFVNLNIESMEKRLVEAALRKHQRNISKTAEELGLTRATLYRRIEKYGF